VAAPDASAPSHPFEAWNSWAGATLRDQPAREARRVPRVDRRAVLTRLAPAVVFLSVRAVGVAVLALMVDGNPTRLAGELRSWDGEWLLGVAGGGYDAVPGGLVDAFGGRTAETPLAFFPGYPAMVSAVRFVTSLNLFGAGLVVSLIAGIFAAYGLARLGELVPGGSRRVGLLLVGLWAAAPMGIVLSMTYSEGLFCAFAVWALVRVLQREWLLAGLACAIAGLVRPTAAALVLAVALAVVVALVRRQDGWRPWVGGLLAPAGLLGYLAFVAANADGGWFGVQQRGWDSRFDGGAATTTFSLEVLASGRSVLEVTTVLVLIGGVVLLFVGIAQRLPVPLLVYGAAVLAMDLGSNGLMNSKARLLLPAFTLLLPVAIGLARRRPGTAWAVLAAATIASAWFGAYALTGWPYAI
jgi:hypothetical protein